MFKSFNISCLYIISDSINNGIIVFDRFSIWKGIVYGTIIRIIIKFRGFNISNIYVSFSIGIIVYRSLNGTDVNFDRTSMGIIMIKNPNFSNTTINGDGINRR